MANGDFLFFRDAASALVFVSFGNKVRIRAGAAQTTHPNASTRRSATETAHAAGRSASTIVPFELHLIAGECSCPLYFRILVIHLTHDMKRNLIPFDFAFLDFNCSWSLRIVEHPRQLSSGVNSRYPSDSSYRLTTSITPAQQSKRSWLNRDLYLRQMS
jgi:hypothetical protein